MGDIRYQFMAVGADGVAGSFRTIEQSALRSKAAVEALFASMKAPSGGFGVGSFSGLGHGPDAGRRGADREVFTTIRHERDERERSVRHVAAIKERYFREEQRREEQADRQAAKAAEARAKGSWAARMGRGAARAGFDLAGMGAGAVTGAAVLAARQAYQLEEAATRISINARQAGQDFIDPRVLRREFQDTAQASPGVKAIDVAEAVQQFITVTGDLDTARKSQKTFATVASATGSSVGDVAQAAAALSMNMGIKGDAQMKEVMAALVGQGKSGSFELRDAASLMPRLAAAAGGFGVEKSAYGVKTLGALTQLARGTSGSAEQAVTGVENIFTNLKAKTGASGKLQGTNVSVYKDGKIRDIVDILTETISTTGGKNVAAKQSKLQKIFGDEGGRAINPLTTAYVDTFNAQMKSGAKEQDAIAAATKAVRKKMTDFIDGAGDWKEVQKDAAKAQESATAKLTAAWERLVASAGDKLAPSLAKLADGLADGRLLDAMAATIEGFGMMAEGASKFLDKIGMGKKQSPYEVENEAKKKLDEFDAAQPTGPMTPQKAAERAQLQGTYDTAHGAAWGKPKSGGFANFDDWNASLGKEFGSVPLERKKELYNDTITSPIKATAELNSGSGTMIDPVSRKAIQDLADQAAASKATGGAVPMPVLVDTRAANKALADLALAADDAFRGFSRSPPGDPLGG